mgnify:CR=1 FL=1
MKEDLGHEKKFSRPYGWLGLYITRAVLLQGIVRTHIPETLQNAASPKEISTPVRLEALKTLPISSCGVLESFCIIRTLPTVISVFDC